MYTNGLNLKWLLCIKDYLEWIIKEEKSTQTIRFS